MTPNDENELAPPDPPPPAEPPPQPSAEAAAAAPAETVAVKAVCANCGAELLGATCYACGQPVKGMVRHLSSILADVADTILNIDSRIFRTLHPLFFKPGFLTAEYLAGRRVRYVTPFRLYFFLSVVAFLVMSISLDATLEVGATLGFDDGESGLAASQTEQQLQTRREAALAALEQSKLAPNLSARARRGIDKAEEQIRLQADRRSEWLKQAAQAREQGKPVPPWVDPTKESDQDDFSVEIGGKKWDPNGAPIEIAWLPGFVNAKINASAHHLVDNLPRIKKNPKPFLLGAFGMLPQVLFLLMPVFAALLKIFYIFKRRLYMEHLIVALHSHSFIFLALLLLTLLGLLRSWTNGAAPWFAALIGWVMFAIGWWLPIYLLIMQKRVYRQGWFFTVLKYLTIGLCYTILVSIGLAIAFVVSLATTSA
jgi:hypothetical protein